MENSKSSPSPKCSFGNCDKPSVASFMGEPFCNEHLKHAEEQRQYEWKLVNRYSKFGLTALVIFATCVVAIMGKLLEGGYISQTFGQLAVAIGLVSGALAYFYHKKSVELEKKLKNKKIL